MKIVSFCSPYLFCLLTAGVEVVYVHLITLRNTSQSVGLLWTRDRPVAEPSTWQHTNTHKRQTSMPPVGFDPTVPVNPRPQIYALDRTATGIGHENRTVRNITTVPSSVAMRLKMETLQRGNVAARLSFLHPGTHNDYFISQYRTSL
jgi:hypothetical protein